VGSVARRDGDGKVVDLVPRSRNGSSLPDVIVAAFSEALRAEEPRSAAWWGIFEAYLRASCEVSR
jgi:hypothetical protein